MLRILDANRANLTEEMIRIAVCNLDFDLCRMSRFQLLMYKEMAFHLEVLTLSPSQQEEHDLGKWQAPTCRGQKCEILTSVCASQILFLKDGKVVSRIERLGTPRPVCEMMMTDLPEERFCNDTATMRAIDNQRIIGREYLLCAEHALYLQRLPPPPTTWDMMPLNGPRPPAN